MEEPAMRRIAASTALMAALAAGLGACSGQSTDDAKPKAADNAPSAKAAPEVTPDGVVVAEGPDDAAKPYGAQEGAGDDEVGPAPQAVAAPIAAPARTSPAPASSSRATRNAAPASRPKRQASASANAKPATSPSSAPAASSSPQTATSAREPSQPTAMQSGAPTAPGAKPPANNSKLIKADPS
jgi:hypothetical protein